MTAGKLKWALGASVAINLFLIAGVIGAGLVLKHHMHDIRRAPSGMQAWNDVEKRLTPQATAHIREVVKTAALGAEPEMAKARALRSEAEKMAGQEPYDAAKIVDLAEQARSYENMSRAKIETALIQDLATLPPKERGLVAGYILRPGFRIRRLLGPPLAEQSKTGSAAVGFNVQNAKSVSQAEVSGAVRKTVDDFAKTQPNVHVEHESASK